jgi:hypothetical protein
MKITSQNGSKPPLQFTCLRWSRKNMLSMFRRTTTCYGSNNSVQTLHISFTNNKQSDPTVETNKRRKQPQTSRQTAAVLHDSFFYLQHYNSNDSKQMLYDHLHKILYNAGIQKMHKFCHLLFLIKRTRWQTWSASRLPQCWVWKSVTHKRLHQTRCLSTPWKDQDTYYNILHRAVDRFDL